MRRRSSKRSFSIRLWIADHVRVVAPWLVASALLISWTATAGHGPATDVTGSLRDAAQILAGGRDALTLEQPLPGEIASEPRFWQRAEPDGRHAVLWIAYLPDKVAFLDDDDVLPRHGSFGGQRWRAPFTNRFQQARRFDGGTSTSSHTDNVPDGSAEQASATRRAASATTPDGGTPSVPRAVSLSSSTPAPVEPELIAMPQVGVPAARGTGSDAASAAKPRRAQPNYASLVDPDDLAKELKCLAEAVYFEARSESESGQAAVAQVVLNRVASGVYPDSICGVVYQNRHNYLACQFTFACEGKSLRITEPGPWAVARRIAKSVFDGQTYFSKVGNATHYHANYVKPWWARKMEKRDKVGSHIFYFERPREN
jgi:hypothetical protein